MIRHPPKSTLSSSSAASDVYKIQVLPAEDQRTRAVPAPQRYGAAGRPVRRHLPRPGGAHQPVGERQPCLLYTSDAADEEDSVDLGGRRIIKKKITKCNTR